MSRSLLLIDDDDAFARVMARALGQRGYVVSVAGDADTALQAIAVKAPDRIVLDLKLGGESGLALIAPLRARAPRARLLLLTGYASIATAVEAIRRGADDYLAKPVDADALIAALEGTAHADPSLPPAPGAPPTLRRLEWEHIQRMLADCGGNVSEAARRLGMHRRSLQRKLAKRPVRER